MPMSGWGSLLPGSRIFPLVLGFDRAGTVAAVGSRVRRLKAGDEVYSYNWQNPKGGFYAEYSPYPPTGRTDSQAT
jgi:NADPH2:quinone reductase